MTRIVVGLVLAICMCSLNVGCGGESTSDPEDAKMTQRREAPEKRGAPGTALGQQGSTEGDAPEGDAAPPPPDGGGG